MPAVAASEAETPAALERDALGVFPASVAVAAGPVLASLDGLAPGELALVARAIEKRRHEFATGRRLARALLARFGHRDFPLLADRDRAPLWPSGIVGSISHSAGACVVAVAEQRRLSSLGVDVEQARAVGPELWPTVLNADEARWLRGQRDPLPLAAVLFSAKEAVYKAQFPLTRARLGFHDVALELDLDARRFRARVPGFELPLLGAFAIRPPWVLTGLALGAGATAT